MAISRRAVLPLSLALAQSCNKQGRKLIAVIPKATSHLFFVTIHKGVDQAAKEFGVDVLWNGPNEETDHGRQIQIVDAMVVHVAVAAVDLQMPYRSVVESDLTRLMLWSNRTHIDSLEAATSDVAGDIVVIDLILGRVGHQLDAAIGKDLTTRISAMKKASSAQDMTGVAEASTTLSKIVSTLSCKPNSVCTY